MNGAERDKAVKLLNKVYDGWVHKAWAEVEAVMHVDKTKEGKAGGMPYGFRQVLVRELLQTKASARAAPQRAAGWVAASLEEVLAFDEKGMMAAGAKMEQYVRQRLRQLGSMKAIGRPFRKHWPEGGLA